ncbi:hypothetical protein JHK82_017945 [Glycine max]|nr:hypothetical protein JHK85_018409 [Glycine max]KAG5142250.1 hypothetical protein JHK82_017945 [Glycine max]
MIVNVVMLTRLDENVSKIQFLDINDHLTYRSAIAVEWAMSELLRHPSDMKKLQELNNVVVVEESDLSKLPYLNMVASERNPKTLEDMIFNLYHLVLVVEDDVLGFIGSNHIWSLFLAQLVHCFNWELPFGMSPDDLDMSEIFGLSLPRSKSLLAISTFRLFNKA